MQNNSSSNWLALDVGGRRIGVALAGEVAKLPHPLTTIINDERIFEQIGQIIKDHNVIGIVIGLPRNLKGEETPQSTITRQFASQLETAISVPIHWQDETLSTHAVKEIARDQGYKTLDIDAAAATIILEDFLSRKPKDKVG